MNKTMRAYLLQNSGEGITGSVQDVPTADLPPGEVSIAVEYSSINFKDAMVNAGIGKMVRHFPHIPGVDFSGTVLEDQSGRFKAGDAVSLTGYEVGLGHFGGYAQYARVPAEWVIKLPEGMSTFEASVLGTAGLTAMMGLLLMERNGLKPSQGPVLITGATGGVGSTGIAIFSKAGYEVAASTGKPETAELLGELGASRILSREEVGDDSSRVLLKEEWAGALDQVGGKTLEYLLRTTKNAGSVAVTGLVEAPQFATSVYPFILRGVNLLGVDSQNCSKAFRQQCWDLLGGTYKFQNLERIARKMTLEELPEKLKEILAGGAKGRYVVKL